MTTTTDIDGPTVTAYPMAVEITLPASSWEMTSTEARVLAGMILDAVREAEAGVR